MKAILLIGTVEAAFLLLLLTAKKKKTVSDFYLGIIFFLFILSIGLTYAEIINSDNGFPFPFIVNLSWLFLFLHGPALWFYITSFSDQKQSFRLIYLLHFIPFLVFLVIQYITFISLPGPEKIELVVTDLFKEKIFYKISVLSIGVSTITYYVWALKLIQNHRLKLMQNYSKIDEFDLNWLRILIIASLICYGINVALFNLDLIFQIASYQILMIYTYSFASVYILVLGYFGLTQGNVFIRINGNSEAVGEPVFEAKTELQSESGNSFVPELLGFMENKKPWLDPELTITRLSEMLDVKVNYLSGAINSELNRNFFDFVNNYRIAEFKNQVISGANSHLSIMGIAYNCGFNSKASFYRAFKKFEGFSPTDYIQSVSQKSETPEK